MGTDNSRDPLQAYIDDLLADGEPLAASDAGSLSGAQHSDENALKLVAGGNVAPLATARPRTAATRPYAEPVRTINLRMPLPPIAPPQTETPPVEASFAAAKIAVEIAAPVEKQSTTGSSPSVEMEAPAAITTSAEISALFENRTPVETQTSPETAFTAVEPADAQIDFAEMAAPPAWLSNGRPQWAQQPFECLIFKAGGLQLAAPLVELGSIYPLENDALTEIFGQTQWFMGLLPVKAYNVRAMDTALVVMPERYNAAMRENYRYVVSLFGSDWGLAVDAVVGTVLLDPDCIRWRGERGKRPWLAGTLIEQMCALFDIAQLAWLFHNQDRKRAPRR